MSTAFFMRLRNRVCFQIGTLEIVNRFSQKKKESDN